MTDGEWRLRDLLLLGLNPTGLALVLAGTLYSAGTLVGVHLISIGRNPVGVSRSSPLRGSAPKVTVMRSSSAYGVSRSRQRSSESVNLCSLTLFRQVREETGKLADWFGLSDVK
ncbi:hypothetical protein [Halosimplex sp. J119]